MPVLVLVPVLLVPFIYLMAERGKGGGPDNAAIALHACEEACREWREYTEEMRKKAGLEGGCAAMILPGSPEGDIMFFLCTEAELDLATTKGLSSQCKCTEKKWHWALRRLKSLGQSLSQVIYCTFIGTHKYKERPMPIICVATCKQVQSARVEASLKARNVKKPCSVPDKVWLLDSIVAANLPLITNPREIATSVQMRPTHTREEGQVMIYDGVKWDRTDGVGDQKRKVKVAGKDRSLVLSDAAGNPVAMKDVIKIIYKYMTEMNNNGFDDKYGWKASQTPFLQVRPGPRRVAGCGD